VCYQRFTAAQSLYARPGPFSRHIATYQSPEKIVTITTSVDQGILERLSELPRRPRVATRTTTAAPTLIPGVVFSGSMDGKLRAHSTRDGALLWSFETLTQPGGGSLDIYSAIAAQGLLIVPSGSATPGGLPGNVVLTFTVDGR